MNAYKEPYGGLIADIDLTFIWDLVASLTVGKKGLSCVVDGDGRFIAHSDMARIDPGAPMQKKDLVPLIDARGKREGVVKDYHAGTSMAAAAPIGNQRRTGDRGNRAHEQPLVEARYGGQIAESVDARLFAKGFQRESFEKEDGSDAHDAGSPCGPDFVPTGRIGTMMILSRTDRFTPESRSRR